MSNNLNNICIFEVKWVKICEKNLVANLSDISKHAVKVSMQPANEGQMSATKKIDWKTERLRCLWN